MQQRIFLVLRRVFTDIRQAFRLPRRPSLLELLWARNKNMKGFKMAANMEKVQKQMQTELEKFQGIQKGIESDVAWQLDIFLILSVKTWLSIGPLLYQSRVLKGRFLTLCNLTAIK